MKSQVLAFNYGGASFTGRFARDERRQGRHPVAPAIHEATGPGEHVREKTERIVRECGYAAYAMVLFGEVLASLDSVIGWIHALVADPVMLRGRPSAALEARVAQLRVDPAKLAAIGCCAGSDAYAYAANADRRSWAAMSALFAKTLGA